MSNTPNQKIARSIPANTILCVMILLLITSILSLIKASSQIISSYEIRANSKGRLTAAIISSPLNTGDTASIKQICDELITISKIIPIAQIRVFDASRTLVYLAPNPHNTPTGTLKYHTEKTGNLSIPHSLRGILTTQHPASYPINIDKNNIGHLELLFDTSAIHASIIRLAATYLLISLAITITLYVIIRVTTTIALRPIHKLRHFVDNMALSGSIEKLSFNSSDEIATLASSLNTLLDKLNTLNKTLDEKHQLAESHRQITDAVIDSIPSGIVILDPSGNIRQANKSFIKGATLHSTDFAGKPFSDIFPQWELENTGDIISKVLRTATPYHNDRIYYSTPDSPTLTVFNAHVFPLFDNHGTPAAALIILDFLTDKILLEEHLMHANEELMRANVVKSEFLSVVSHELRTPLTLIKMYSAMMAELRLGPLTDRQAKAVEVMNRRCENLNNLINDLLDLSRIESGRMEINLEKIPLPGLISEIATLYEPKAHSAGLQFHASCPPHLPPVSIDRDKIGRVFINLLDNALKFTEKGSISLSVDTDPQDPRFARIAISDSGLGIPDEYHHKIFDKFFQIDASDTRKHGGTGLGLSIAREITTLHQGRLWLLSSTETSGSTFAFTIPFADPADTPQISSPSQPPLTLATSSTPIDPATVRAATSGKHILMIDDDQDFLDIMSQLLSEDGFYIITARDGFRALETLFQGEQIDAILLDITMSGITGYDLCRMIKSVPSLSHIPIIMLTASGQRHQIQNGYDAGAVGFIVKPFDIHDFRKTLFHILEDNKP